MSGQILEYIQRFDNQICDAIHKHTQHLETEVQRHIASLKKLDRRKQARRYKYLNSRIRHIRREIKSTYPRSHTTAIIRALTKSHKTNGRINQQKLSLFSNLLSIYGVPTTDLQKSFFINVDTCSDCKQHFVFDVRSHKASCPSCGISKNIIYCKQDMKRDYQTYVYRRIPLYRRFLKQFSIKIKEIPRHVIETCYNDLLNIRTPTDIKVRVTPILSILRKHKLQQWTYMSIRITKELNNQPIPLLTEDQISVLGHRFCLINRAFISLSKERKKILNFEYLTKQFLYMEGLTELADKFTYHKTKAVLDMANSLMSACIDYLYKHDLHENLNWKLCTHRSHVTLLQLI